MTRMKLLTLFFTLGLVRPVGIISQTVGSDATQIKTFKNPDPVFPASAKSYIYGDVVRVEVDVNEGGKVTYTRPVGPLMPCSNRKDKAVAEIQKAAVDAAKATVFEPILKNGKPGKISLFLSYQLPLPMEDRPARVGPHRAKRLPAPTYSPSAKAQRISGSVELSVLVDENGRVLSFSVISGHPLLAAGTFDSICRAEYEPFEVAGKPSKVIGKVTYNFAL